MRRSSWPLCISFCLLLAANEARCAEDPGPDGRIPWFPVLASELKGPYPILDGGAGIGKVRSGVTAPGGEARAGLVWRPFEDFILGPRAGISAFGADGLFRLDASVGAEATLWFVNAVGTGVGADYQLPLSTRDGGDESGRLRVATHLRLRLFRLGRFSAAAPRLEVGYDFSYGWGVQAGLHLQFGGVP